MVRIILIRHGETNWNLQGRYQGQEDTRLSEPERKRLCTGRAFGARVKKRTS